MSKNKEIHLLRGVTITSVVFIHLFNLALINIKPDQMGYSFYQILHTLLQFAVPCFIFISSLVFSYTLRDKSFHLLSYIKKKFTGIFLPYVCWTFFYLLIQIILGYIPLYKLFRLRSWFYWLAYGKAYTHLYFMSVIVQFFIVAPILFFIIKCICKYIQKYQLIVISLFAFLPQLAIYWINRLYIYQYFSSTATLFVWYWCISIIGLWIGLNYDKWTTLFNKYKYIFFSSFILSTILYLYYRICILNKSPINTFYYQIIWYLYVLLASLLLLYICKKLSNVSLFDKWFSYVADYSFEIYFIHPLFTFIICRLIKISNPLVLLIIILIAYKVVIELCCFIAKLIRHYKLVYWTVGKHEIIHLDLSEIKL